MTAIEIMTKLETEILNNISKYACKGDIGSTLWQVERMGQIGRLNSINETTIRKYIVQFDDKMKKEVEQEIKKYSNKIDDLYKIAIKEGVALNEVLPQAADETLRLLIKQADDSLSGLSNMLGNSMLTNAGSVYADIINQVTMENLTGVYTKEEAIQRALGKWADVGLPSLVDSAGRRWSPESYARMQINTAKSTAMNNLALERVDQYNSDLVEVDAHIGARPKCSPYQGNVYSVKGKTQGYDLLSSTSYGEAAGLFGINCGHHMYPFFEGISERTYVGYDVKRNEEAYRNSQKQRYHERRIRSAKREISMLKSGGQDINEATKKLKSAQLSMTKFIKRSKRTRRYAREKIA